MSRSFELICAIRIGPSENSPAAALVVKPRRYPPAELIAAPCIWIKITDIPGWKPVVEVTVNLPEQVSIAEIFAYSLMIPEMFCAVDFWKNKTNKTAAKHDEEEIFILKKFLERKVG